MNSGAERSLRITSAFLLALITLIAGAIDLRYGLAQDAAQSGKAAESPTVPTVDIDGDPLPAGVVARLGTKRFHTSREPVAISFLADGKTLAQTTRDGYLQHWDTATGKLLREKRFSEHELAAAPAAPNGRLVAVHGFYTDGDKQELINWLGVVSQLSGAWTMEMKIPDRMERQLALSPDGQILAYGGDGVHLIDVPGKTEILTKQFGPRQISTLSFSPDGKLLAIGTMGKVLLWNWKDNEEPRSIDIAHDPRYSPGGMDVATFSSDGTTLAVSNRDSHGVLLFDTTTGQAVRSFGLPGVDDFWPRAAAFSPDGKLLAAALDDRHAEGGVGLWEVSSGKLVRRLNGRFGSTSALAFSPDGQRLAALSSWDRALCCWNLETGEAIGANLPGHEAPPNSLRFFNGDRQLASAGDDGTIHIWNLADETQSQMMQHTPDGHQWGNWIRGMDVSPDGKFIVSSSLDDTVRLWETSTGREIYRLPGHGHLGGHRAVRFTPDSKEFASWGDDMRVYLWDVSTGKARVEFLAQPNGVKLPEMDGVPAAVDHMRMAGLAGRFSPDASRLAMFLDKLFVFDTATGKELAKLDCSSSIGPELGISPDGQYLMVSNWGRGQPVSLKDGRVSHSPATDHPVELWSLTDNQLVTKFEMAGAGAGPTAISPDSRRVALTGIDDPSRLEVHTIPELAEVAAIELPSRPSAVEFSGSGKLLATSMADRTVLVWDLDRLPPSAKP